MDYPLTPAKTPPGEWKINIAALATLIVILGGAWLIASRGSDEIAAEREFATLAAITDKRVTDRIGRVKDWRVKRTSSGRRSRDALEREVSGNIVKGRMSFYVFGENGGGEATVAYRFDHATGDKQIEDITVQLAYGSAP